MFDKANGNALDYFDDKLPGNYSSITFGELKRGERFISLPTPGDNDGHGGFIGPYYVFQKINLIKAKYDALGVNSVRQRDGNFSHMPDSMLVIKVE